MKNNWRYKQLLSNQKIYYQKQIYYWQLLIVITTPPKIIERINNDILNDDVIDIAESGTIDQNLLKKINVKSGHHIHDYGNMSSENVSFNAEVIYNMKDI